MNKFKAQLTIGFILLVLGAFVSIAGFFFSSWVETLLIIAGIILMGFGIRMLFLTDENRRKFLKTNGLKIQAKIKYISVEVSALVGFSRSGVKGGNNITSFEIICDGQGINANSLKEYVSAGLSLQPDIQIDSNSLIDVYVNPKDENDYLVDISKIPVKNYAYFDRPWNITTVHYRSYDGINYQKIESPS
jgi:hypothetical protein